MNPQRETPYCANCNSVRFLTDGAKAGAYWCFVFRRAVGPVSVCSWFRCQKTGRDLQAVLSPGSYVTPGLSAPGCTFPPKTAQKIGFSNGQKTVAKAPPGMSFANGIAFRKCPA